MRSVWKGPYIDNNLLKTYQKPNFINSISVNKDRFKTRSRKSTILPVFEKQVLKIYNGRNYFILKPTISHIGHKLGNFIFTKKRCTFVSKKTTTNKRR